MAGDTKSNADLGRGGIGPSARRRRQNSQKAAQRGGTPSTRGRTAPSVTPSQASTRPLRTTVNYNAPRVTSRPASSRQYRQAQAAQTRQSRAQRKQEQAKARKAQNYQLLQSLQRGRTELSRLSGLKLTALPKPSSKLTLTNPQEKSKAQTATELIRSLQRGRDAVSEVLPRTTVTGSLNAKKKQGFTSLASSQLGAELAGKGEFAKLSANLGKKVGPALGTALISGVLKTPTASKIPVLNDEAKAFGSELVNLPAQAVPSVYVPAAGAVEAAQGKPQRINQFWGDLKKNDALYAAATGQPAEAVKRARKAPLTTVLELRGAKAIVGRTAGAAARRSPSSTLRRAGSQSRTPLKVYGNVKVDREYSPDLINKAVQVLAEKRKVRKGIDPNQATGRQLERAVKRRVDIEVNRNEVMRRNARGEAIQKTVKAKPYRQAHRNDAVPLIAEGVIRSRKTIRADLKTELVRLKKARAKLPAKSREKYENGRQIATVEKLLGDKKFLEKPDKAFAAAEAYAKEKVKAEATRIQMGDLTAEQAARSPLVPFAVRELGAEYDPVEKRLTIAGQPITNAEIRNLMKATGVKPERVSYVPEQPGMATLRSAFYKSTSRRPSPVKSRTGTRALQGSYDRSYDALIAGASDDAARISAGEGVNNIVDTFGVGEFKAWKEADRASQRLIEYADDPKTLRATGGLEMVPFRYAAFGTKKEALDMIRSTLDPANPEDVANQLGVTLRDGFRQGPGPVTLIPAIVRDRLFAHENATPGSLRTFQTLTSQFRQTVLPLSTKWMAGNVIELILRSAVDKVGPIDWATGRRIWKAAQEKDPDKAARVQADAFGGLLYGSAKRWNINRTVDQFQNSSPPVRAVARALAVIRRTPGPKQLVDGWTTLRDSIFTVNRLMEDEFNKAFVGQKAIREWRKLEDNWYKSFPVANKAIEDLANGLLETDSQIKYGEYIRKTAGQYAAFGPAERTLIQNYAPFYAWYRNALRFVLLTLPAEHPIITGGLAMAYNASKPQLDAAGLNATMKGGAPAFLQGSIPVGNEKLRFPYTPFGAFSDPLGTAAGQVLPQTSFTDQLEGIKFTGDKLRLSNGDEPTTAQRALLALNALFESYVPLVRQARTVMEKGGSAYDDSSIFGIRTRPDTQKSTGAGVNKAFNPFRPTKPLEKNKKKAKKSGAEPFSLDSKDGGPKPFTLPGGTITGAASLGQAIASLFGDRKELTNVTQGAYIPPGAKPLLKQLPAEKGLDLTALEKVTGAKRVTQKPLEPAANENKTAPRKSSTKKTKAKKVSDKVSKDPYLSVIEKAAKKNGLDPSVLYGVWGVENNFSKGGGATSGAGAKGPFQFIDSTARAMGLKNPSDFRESAFAAAKLLGDGVKQYGSVEAALRAYNSGDPTGKAGGSETAAYVPKVLALAKDYPGAKGSSPGEPVVPAGKRFKGVRGGDGGKELDGSPELLARLSKLSKIIGKPITTESEYRSDAEQQRILNEGGAGPIAPVGQSYHRYGVAADAYVDGQRIQDVVSPETLARAGLRGLEGDNPHVEIAGPGGRRLTPQEAERYYKGYRKGKPGEGPSTTRGVTRTTGKVIDIPVSSGSSGGGYSGGGSSSGGSSYSASSGGSGSSGGSRAHSASKATSSSSSSSVDTASTSAGVDEDALRKRQVLAQYLSSKNPNNPLIAILQSSTQGSVTQSGVTPPKGAKARTGKASTYGNYGSKYRDAADNNVPALAGASNDEPGIAVLDRKTLGGWWLVESPDGKQAVLRQTDIGPSSGTGRVVDINAKAAKDVFGLGYGNKFPTDAGQWRITYLGKKKP